MDSKSAFHIYKQTLIRRNNVPVSSVYNFDQKDKLGQGNYGVVYKAVHKISKQVRALKVISKKNIKYKERLLNEITIMELMDHPNILRLFETFEDAENLYMILEICSGGDVFDKVLEKGNMTADESFRIYVQYMRAVYYYQNFGIAHRDLKPENFLFQKKDDLGSLTVIDFGIAKKVTDKLKTKSGTAYYVAPEVLEGCYDARCDIWSAGVILYVILCGYPPFYGENEKEILNEIRNGTLQFEGDEWAPISQEIKDFIRMHICQMDKRATPKELLNTRLVDQFIQKTKQDPKIISMQQINQWIKYHPLKRLALLYLATQMDSADLKNQKQAFFFVNTSQTGLITQQELATYLKVTKPDVAKVWPYLDCNYNGFVDYFEFVAITLTPQDYQKSLQMMFDFLSNQEKLITVKSIQTLFDQNFNLAHKWDSIAENKGQPRHSEQNEQQVNVKTIIEKDLDFGSFKGIMQ